MGIALRHFVTAIACIAATLAHADDAVEPLNPARAGPLVLVAGEALHAIDADAGHVAWRALDGLQTFAPTLAGDRAYVGTTDGLAAIRLEDGHELWRIARGQTVYTPILVGRRLYAGSLGGALLAIDARQGKQIWQRRFDGWVYTPAWSDGRLVVGGRAGRLWWVDPASGEVTASRSMDQELVFRPVAVGGGVAVATFAGTLTHLSPDGKPRWQTRVPLSAGSPTPVGDALLVAGLDGSVVLLASEDGQPRWRSRLGTRITAAPRVIDGGRAVVASESGRIGLLDVSARRWVRRGELSPHESPAQLLAADGGVRLVVLHGSQARLRPWPPPPVAARSTGAPIKEENTP